MTVSESSPIDALADVFGFEFTTFEEYLREHGWEDEEGMGATPWVKTL